LKIYCRFNDAKVSTKCQRDKLFKLSVYSFRFSWWDYDLLSNKTENL